MGPIVLIVDDSADGTLLTELALNMLHKRIRAKKVSSGTAALEFMHTAAELPALVLLDLTMPGINGIETLKKIRADERLKNIPVVVTTVSTLETDREAAEEAGANGFVHKAIRLHDFGKDLEKHIKFWTEK